jgi:hypothetical protein
MTQVTEKLINGFILGFKRPIWGWFQSHVAVVDASLSKAMGEVLEDYRSNQLYVPIHCIDNLHGDTKRETRDDATIIGTATDHR